MTREQLKSRLAGAWRSRTMWISTALAIIGIIESQADLLDPYISRHIHGEVMIFCGVLMGVLRIFTVTAVGDERKKECEEKK